MEKCVRVILVITTTHTFSAGTDEDRAAFLDASGNAWCVVCKYVSVLALVFITTLLPLICPLSGILFSSIRKQDIIIRRRVCQPPPVLTTHSTAHPLDCLLKLCKCYVRACVRACGMCARVRACVRERACMRMLIRVGSDWVCGECVY